MSPVVQGVLRCEHLAHSGHHARLHGAPCHLARHVHVCSSTCACASVIGRISVSRSRRHAEQSCNWNRIQPRILNDNLCTDASWQYCGMISGLEDPVLPDWPCMCGRCCCVAMWLVIRMRLVCCVCLFPFIPVIYFMMCTFATPRTTSTSRRCTSSTGTSKGVCTSHRDITPRAGRACSPAEQHTAAVKRCADMLYNLLCSSAKMRPLVLTTLCSISTNDRCTV